MKIVPKAQVQVVGKAEIVPFEHIVTHPDIPLRAIDKDHVNSLVLSITKNGLDQPLIVWDGEGTNAQIGGKEVPGRFLIAGLHRRSAIKTIKKENPDRFKALFGNGVPCIVRSGNAVSATAAQLRENLNRKNMELKDVLPHLQALRDTHKLDGKAIAAEIGMSPSYVSMVLQLEKTLGKDVVEDVAAGGATIREAQAAAKAVKAKAKKGEDVEKAKTEEVTKLKAKVATRKSAGKERSEKRRSVKSMYEAYKALPSMNLSKTVDVLEGILDYATGESDDIPEEIVADEEQEEPKAEKK